LEEFFVTTYEVGGSGSLLTTASGFLRSVKKPTRMGIKMAITEKQSNAYPTDAGNIPEFCIPLTSVLYGILPDAVTAPKMHANKPQHPQMTAEVMVAIMPVVFLSIFFVS
jgi:hypothetical protein